MSLRNIFLLRIYFDQQTVSRLLQQQQLDEQGEQLQTLRQQNGQLQQALGTKEQDQQYRWWREGGYIAGAGLLLGLLLPFLPRPRRRKERWMN